MMKRVVALGLVLSVLTALVAPFAVSQPARAVDIDEFATLAGFFPAETTVFIAFRTDDAFIAEVDETLASVTERLPLTSPVPSLTDLLDEGSEMTYGDTFANTFRPWLGDIAAIGITDLTFLLDDDPFNDVDVPALLVFSINDAAAAEAFVESTLDDMGMDYERSTDDVLTYEVDEPHLTILISEGALVMQYNDIEVVGLGGSALGGETPFNVTMASLPESDYNIVGYFDVGDALAFNLEQMSESFYDDELAGLFERLLPIYELYPQLAIGLTVLDDDTLVMDSAALSTDLLSLLTNIGIEFNFGAYAPVDLGLVDHVPADTVAFMHATGTGAMIEYMLDLSEEVMDIAFEEIAEQAAREFDAPDLSEFTGSDVIAFFELSVKGMFGVNLYDDVLANLNDDALYFARLLPSDNALGMTYDAAAVISLGEADMAASAFGGLVAAFERYGVEYSVESDTVVNLPRLIRGFFPVRMSRTVDALPELDFLVGYSDNLLVSGTRFAAEYSLAQEGESLAAGESFVAAQDHFLTDTVLLWYFDFDNLDPALDMVAADASDIAPGDEDEIDMVLAAIRLFESASATATIAEDGSIGVSRLAITLAE